MIVWLVETSPCVFYQLPAVAGTGVREPRTPRLSQEQGGCDPPLFLHQNVERAARRAEVHDLETYAALRKRRSDPRRRKPLRHSRAEQNYLGPQGEYRLQVCRRESGKARRLPVGDQLISG